MRAPRILRLLLLVSLAAPAAHAFPLFGPGPHWIDEVTGGTVMFGTEASVDLDFDFDAAADLTVKVSGTTTVFRSAAREGDPIGDPGHRNHLDLEIVSATLGAPSSPLGPVTIRFGDGTGNLSPDGPLYSGGTSDEIPGSPELAADAFDIFFEVEAAGVRLHNVAPLRMEAVIDKLPPIDNPFTSKGPPVPLVSDTGAPLMQVIETRYTPVLIPPTPCDPNGRDAEPIAAARVDVAARCDCAGTSAHREYVRCSAEVLAARLENGLLNPRCRREVQRCAARSTCGRPGSVTCCRTNVSGVVKCSIKSDAVACRPPENGAACVGQSRSCCDACPGPCP